MEEVIKTLQYFWSHLNDPIKGFRPKTFSASLTGIPWERYGKAVKSVTETMIIE
jgi:hypothetical protein